MARIVLLALLLALAACGPPPRTQDRLTLEAMSGMVEAPIRHAEAGDVQRAQREFEALLARSDPEDASDMLSAFGVGLYTLGAIPEGDYLRYRRLSLPYFERAIPAARSRFGLWHPEVALVLATYGDALWKATSGDPPRRVDQLFAEAYLIRERILGPGNAETVAGLVQLARVRSLPSRTQGDPGRIAEVGQMYEEAVGGLEANGDPYSPAPETVRFEQLEMYVRNGLVARALEVARSADARSRDRMPGCEIGPNRRALAEILAKGGRKAAAGAVIRPSSPQPPGCGVDAAFMGRDS